MSLCNRVSFYLYIYIYIYIITVQINIKENIMKLHDEWIVAPVRDVDVESTKTAKEKEHYLIGDYIVYRGQCKFQRGMEVTLNGVGNVLYSVGFFLDRVNGIVEFNDNLYANEKLKDSLIKINDGLPCPNNIYPMSQLETDRRKEHSKRLNKRKKTLRMVIEQVNNTGGKVLVHVPTKKIYTTYKKGKLNGLAKFLGYDDIITYYLKKGVMYQVEMDNYGYVTVTSLEDQVIITG